MFLIFATLALALMLAVTASFVFREIRRLQRLDRRLAGVREWAVTVYGKPERRQKRTGAPLSLHLYLTGVLNIAAMLVPVGTAERAKLRQLLIRAGFSQPDALSVFMAFKLIVTLGAGGLGGLLAARGHVIGDSPSMLLIGLVGLVGGVIGGLVPEVGLRQLSTRRNRRLTTALPDALDLMTLCLESGLTFERSLSRVVLELRPLAPDLARELTLVEAELQLGADRKTALNALYTRTEVEGIRSLTTTIVQGERYGTPLAQAIRNTARNERLRRAARIAAQVERLPVLMTLPMLLLVTPGTLLLVAGPAFLITMDALRNIGG